MFRSQTPEDEQVPARLVCRRALVRAMLHLIYYWASSFGSERPSSKKPTESPRASAIFPSDTVDTSRVPKLGPGAARTRPDTLLADRGYTSRGNREYLRSRGISAVIPEKSTEIAARKRKGSVGGRPPGFDHEAYRNRNVVERAFGLLKQWRGIATRYDKLAVTYRAGVVIAAILTWLRI